MLNFIEAYKLHLKNNRKELPDLLKNKIFNISTKVKKPFKSDYLTVFRIIKIQIGILFTVPKRRFAGINMALTVFIYLLTKIVVTFVQV